MSYSPYSIQERFNLVTTCLSSGVSICTWCKENNIPTGTFYSWINQVKKSGYQVNYPQKVTSHQVESFNRKQEVVKVDIIQEKTEVIDYPQQPFEPESLDNDTNKVLTLKSGSLVLEIPNGTDMTLLSQVISAMRI